MFKNVNQDVRQKIALVWASSNDKGKLLTQYGLGTDTVLSAIRGDRAYGYREDTYDKLIALANGTPIKKEKSGKSSVAKSQSKPQSAVGETIAPKISPTQSDASLKLLQQKVNGLKELFEIDHMLTETLINRIDNATKSMDEETKRSIDNFIRSNEALNKKVDDLNKQFEVLLQRHKYQSDELKNIKERVKKLEIKAWPTKIVK